jgi:hypothetical protein
MSPEVIQIVFWLLVATVVMVAFELHESLKPSYCEHCAHCQALQEAEAERRRELHDAFKRNQPISWDRDDDQHQRGR